MGLRARVAWASLFKAPEGPGNGLHGQGVRVGASVSCFAAFWPTSYMPMPSLLGSRHQLIQSL